MICVWLIIVKVSFMSRELALSDKASGGFGCASKNIPAMPTAAALLANAKAKLLSPPVPQAKAPGFCRECVKSKMTGYPVRFIISKERISTIKSP